MQQDMHSIEDAVSFIRSNLKKYNWKEVKDYACRLEAPEISEIMDGLDKKYWSVFFRILPNKLALEVFVYLDPYISAELIERLTDKNLKTVLETIPPDDRTAIFEELPGVITRKLFKFLPPEELQETKELLGYPEDSIGRMMTPDYVSTRINMTVGQNIEYIRRNSVDKELISMVYVIDNSKHLIGSVELRDILAADDSTLISDLVKKDIFSLSALADRETAIAAFQTYDLPAIPVTDSNSVLIGIVTFDDVLDVQEEETTEDIQKSSAITPLEFTYLHTTILSLFKKRFGWLLFLMVTALLSSGIIAYFSDIISMNVSLSFFIPVLIGAGGNTGAQSATLIIRALSTGDLQLSQWGNALKKELVLGVLIGLTLGILLFAYCNLFLEAENSFQISLVAGISMFFLIIWSNLAGALLPMLITRLKFDPAVVSNPFLATLVDAAGLIIYFLTADYILGI